MQDILDNIAAIEVYTAGLDYSALADDRLRQDAIERCLERICEAAMRLGKLAPELAPAQPWADIRGMGNWLRHAYERVAFDLIWGVVRNRLPSLKADTERALAKLGTGESRS